MKHKKLFIRFLTAAIISSAALLQNCLDVPRDNDADMGGDNFNDIYSDKRITAFSFVDPAVNGVINEGDSTIIVYVLYGTDVTSLAAEFKTNAESVSVNGREQKSGITVNDFSRPLYYEITALDGSSKDYRVSTEFVVIESFSVTDPAWDLTIVCTINNSSKTISGEIPYYADISNLAADFQAVGNVSILEIEQVSGTTINDFTSPVTYETEGDNGEDLEYTVTINYKDVTVAHMAGSTGGPGNNDGIGASASFRMPSSVVADMNNMNTLYVADSGNHTIRKIEINTGNVTTLAGAPGQPGSTDATGANARFNNPEGIATDGVNLYVTDSYNCTIRKIVISTGSVTTIAGLPDHAGIEDGTGSAARFAKPSGITTNGINLYVSDTNNHTIRQIVISTGAVTTIAGLAENPDFIDGSGTAARFNSPRGITTDGINLYIADQGNNAIRQILIENGEVTTVTGNGTEGRADGTLNFARFAMPYGIATDGVYLYVSDFSNYTIRKIDVKGDSVTTFAGPLPSVAAGRTGNTDAFGNDARFYIPAGITTNGTNLYVTEQENNTVRTISLGTRWVGTLAGAANIAGSDDKAGADARFCNPKGITTDGNNLYLADYQNHTIRGIEISSADLTTIAGLAGANDFADDSDGYSNGIIESRFICPTGVTTYGNNIYVADTFTQTIRRIVISDPDAGQVTTIAGTPKASGVLDDYDGDPGVITSRFNYPEGIATDGANLYVTDTNSHTIRKIELSSGNVITVGGSTDVFGAADDLNGYPDPNAVPPVSEARFGRPTGITTDGTNLYICDSTKHTIRKMVISTGVVTTIAGTSGSSGYADDQDGFTGGISSQFNTMQGITNDGINLFVADSFNHAIRKIVISTGAVSTIAGKTGTNGRTNGAGSIASLNEPAGIIFLASARKLFISDKNNNAIRVISP